MTANHHHRPFTFRPICHAGEMRMTHRTAYASYCYILRTPEADRFGVMPREWSTRGDLVVSGREHPAQTPAWAKAGPQIWQEADASITDARIGEAAAFHIVLSLPRDQDAENWQHLVEEFCRDVLCPKGMVADWAIHFLPGQIEPHAHLVVTARTWRRDRNPGRRHPRWFTTQEAILAAERQWIRISGAKPLGRFRIAA
jgi:hypothetical protein